MLSRRIIPCLDVRDGRVVKGVQFLGLRDAGDPSELAERYERDGADEITLLDVSATEESRFAAVRTVAAVRGRISIPLCVGGGVRGVEDAARLLEAGADKVSINTAAVREPRVIGRCAELFGVQCVVVAIDARRWDERRVGWDVLVRSGRERVRIDAVEWAARAAELGAGEVLLTSWDRDGTRMGYDLELIEAVASRVRVPVIASGGAAGPAHMLAAFAHGADAVLAASIFHDGDCTVRSIKGALLAGGVEVRA